MLKDKIIYRQDWNQYPFCINVMQSKENEEKDDASELLDILKNNDALREQLKKMLSL